jgi:hypothetical protein
MGDTCPRSVVRLASYGLFLGANMKRLTDEELAELESDAGSHNREYLEMTTREIISIVSEVRELRALKARVEGYRERLAAKLDHVAETWTELGNWQQAVHRIADEAREGYFDEVVFGEEEV